MFLLPCLVSLLPFITPILAIPSLASSDDSIYKRDDCHGSGHCGKDGASASALEIYNQFPNNESIYNAYTSYTAVHYTAIYTCQNGKYPAGISGADIFNWGQQIFKPKSEGGDQCGFCGTHWLKDSENNLKCRITLNYCANCKEVVNNVAGAGAGLPPPATTVVAAQAAAATSTATSTATIAAAQQGSVAGSTPSGVITPMGPGDPMVPPVNGDPIAQFDAIDNELLLASGDLGSGNGDMGSDTGGMGSGNGDMGSDTGGMGSGNGDTGSGTGGMGSGNGDMGSGTGGMGSGNGDTGSGTGGMGSGNGDTGSGTGGMGSGNGDMGSGTGGIGSGNGDTGSGTGSMATA